MIKWSKIKSEVEYLSPFVSVNKDIVKLPNGSIIPDFYTVGIHDAASVAAVVNDKILLIKEYRCACKEMSIECPAGMVESGEEPLIAAKRELLEETGYESDNWIFLGPTFESTSKLTNTMYLYIAEDCVKVSNQKLDNTESIEVMEVTLDEAVQMVMDGRIKANSSAHAILRVWMMKHITL